MALRGVYGSKEKSRGRRWLGAIIASVIATPALGGPPYVTDDPEPAAVGEIESYVFTEGALAPVSNNETESGFEINYGAMPDVQLSAELSAGHEGHVLVRWRGVGAGLKYRFLHETPGTPQASFYPAIEIGNGETRVVLPVWLAKTFGDWTVFGGGGYSLNGRHDQRDTWFGGAALSREILEDLSLGAEVYGETPDIVGESGLVGMRAAMTQALSEHFSLLASVGPEFEGRETRTAYYVAVGWHG